MNLQDFAKPIKAKNNFIKASFGGFAGSGKTRTATELIVGAYKSFKCNKPILFIDNEKGSRFLIPIFEKAGIPILIKDTNELADVIKAFEYLNNGEISFLFIDSLTKIWYKYVNNYKSKNNRVFMTLQDWGKILPAWQEEFADKFVELTGNCIFTGRGGYTYDMEENERGKKEFVKSGVKMKMAGETPFEPDLNIWMEACQKIGDNDKPVIWREALIMKDRSGLIDGRTFKNPTYKDFEPVLKYLIDVPKGEVAGATDKTNLSPKENYDSIENAKNKEIFLDKIKNLWIKSHLGSSANDKEVKLLVCEKCFSSPGVTWIEIENMKLHLIQKGQNIMEKMFEKLEYKITKDSVLKYEIPFLGD